MYKISGCGHCRRAKPEFIKAAERYKDDPYVDFAAVDCSTEKSLCNDQGVKGYPTIKYFGYYSRVVRPYNGGRTVEYFSGTCANISLYIILLFNLISC